MLRIQLHHRSAIHSSIPAVSEQKLHLKTTYPSGCHSRSKSAKTKTKSLYQLPSVFARCAVHKITENALFLPPPERFPAFLGSGPSELTSAAVVEEERRGGGWQKRTRKAFRPKLHQLLLLCDAHLLLCVATLSLCVDCRTVDPAIAQRARNSTWNVNASVDYSVCEDEVLDAAEDSILPGTHTHQHIFGLQTHTKVLCPCHGQHSTGAFRAASTGYRKDLATTTDEEKVIYKQTEKMYLFFQPLSPPLPKKSCDDTLTQSRTHTHS